MLLLTINTNICVNSIYNVLNLIIVSEKVIAKFYMIHSDFGVTFNYICVRR